MNKFLQKLAKLFLGISMAVGVGVAIGAGKAGAGRVDAATRPSASDGVFLIDFYDESKISSTSGTNLSNSNYSGFVKVATGLTATNVVTACSVSGTVRYGMNGGLTLGANNNNAASATFTIGSSYAVTKISVYGAKYDSNTLTIGGNQADSGTIANKGTTFANLGNPMVWDNLGGITSIVLSKTSGKRVTAYTLVCEYSTSPSGPTQLAAPSPTYNSSTNKVEWSAVANASSYQVKVGSGSYATATSPYDGNFQAGTSYTVYVIAKGDGTNYSDSEEGSTTFTVPTPFVSKDFVQCTSTSDLEADATYIITNGTSGSVATMSTVANTNNRKTTTVSVSNSKIASTSATLMLTLGGSTGAWTFHTENYTDTDGYLTPGSTTSNARLNVSANNDSYGLYTISFSSGKAVITSTGKSSYNIMRCNPNNGSPLFACYSSGQNDIYLWKELDSNSLTLDVVKHLDYVGNDFELNADVNGYTPTTWTWSSSPTGVVTIDDADDYAIISPVGAGTTTISVTATDGSVSKTATCSVTITSKSGADTSNLLTIDDAILIAQYTGTTHTSSSYYLEGTVSSMASDKYPVLQGSSKTLEVYKDCSGTVYSGDSIRVYGPIFYYNDTQAEFDNTSTVTLLNIPADSVTVTNSTPIPTSVDDGDLSDYLSVTINGTNSRTATNQGWTVTSSSVTSVISLSGADGKTFDSGLSEGTTILTIASVDNPSKTATISITTIDASKPVLQSVTVSGTPSKATQYVGQTFDWTGLTFTPVYSPVKSPVEEITGANITWNALVAGQNPTGTYTGDDSVSVTVTVTSVSVESDGIYSVHVSGDMSVKTYDEDASWNFSGLVVKVTKKSDHNTQVDPTSPITWNASSTPKQLGVGSGKSVNVTATVDGVQSSAYPVSGITITEHQADKYGEFTGSIEAGQYVIVGASTSNAMKNVVSNDRLTFDEVTITQGIIEDPDSALIWDIQPVTGTSYWTIYNAASEKYLAGVSAKNKAGLSSTVTDLTKWTITYDEGFVFDNLGRHSESDTPNNAYLRLNGGTGWGCYASSTGSAPSLYKLGNLPKAFDHFNYVDGTPDKTSYVVGEGFDPTGLEVHAVYTEPSLFPEENITDYIVWDTLVEGTQATGTWEGHTVTITGLTISTFTPVAYTKITSLDQLAVGSEVIIGGYKSSTSTYYALSTFSTKFFTAESTTGTSSSLTTTSDTLIFTVEADRNGYYFKNGTNYIKRNTSDSAFGTKDSNACWSISIGEEGAVTMTNGDSGNTAFQFNDGDPRFKNYSGTQKSIYIYVQSTPSETDILKTYASRYLLLANETLAQIPSGETGNAGTDCLGLTGPYMTAKAAINSGEFSSHKSDFQSSNDTIVANARRRYEAWARAYGDTTPYATTVGNGSRLLQAVLGENTNTVAIIVIISMVSVTAIGGYFFLRKRKENI